MPYAPSRAFSHWRCINGRAECIAMHSRIIQEDIADSTRDRELVETKVRLAAHRAPVIDRQNFSDTKFHGCASYSNVLRDSNVYGCAHTRQMLISYVRSHYVDFAVEIATDVL